MYYDYQRWYDPSTGRFLNMDPLGGGIFDPQSLNPYVYARNLPTTLIDPTGAAWSGQCFGGGSCEGFTGGLWTESDVQNFIENHGVTDPKLIENCEQNPTFCPTFLRADGYDPTDWGEGGTSPEGGGASGGASSGTPSGASPSPGPIVTVTTIDTPTITDTTGVQSGSSLSDLYSNANFESQNELAQHFEDHGRAMGYQNENEYLSGSRNLLKAGVNGQAEYYVRFNGDMISVDPETGRLAIYNTQGGYIRTYFGPRLGYGYILWQLDPQSWIRIFVE